MANAAPPALLHSREEMSALFDGHLWLANAIVNKFRRRTYAIGLDPDDLGQTARIALWRAAGTHNPDRGGPFEAWAAVCIKNAVLGHFRSYKRLLSLTDEKGNPLMSRRRKSSPASWATGKS